MMYEIPFSLYYSHLTLILVFMYSFLKEDLSGIADYCLNISESNKINQSLEQYKGLPRI